jgi:hypothetical protein
MTTMRAKFQVSLVQEHMYGEHGSKSQETLSMHAVCPDKFDADGLSDDNTFAKYSPGGNLTLCVANPALFDKFKHGDKFYLDFTPAT